MCKLANEKKNDNGAPSKSLDGNLLEIPASVHWIITSTLYWPPTSQETDPSIELTQRSSGIKNHPPWCNKL
jgi:hypothetical protein